MSMGMLSLANTPLPSALPSGALGIWNMADCSPGPNPTVPNRASGASSLAITGGTISAGFLLHGSYSSVASFNTAQNAAAFTVMYLAKHSGTPNHSFESILSVQGNPGYESLSVGPIPAFTGGTLYNNTSIDVTPDGLNTVRPDWWGGISQGPFVGASRYDGTTASSFLNGAKMTNGAITVAAPSSFTNIEIGSIQGGNEHTTYDIGIVVYWPRALSDAEIYQAYRLLASQGIALTSPRTVVSIGDSITFGISASTSFSYLMIPNLAVPAFGANYGHSGSGIGNWEGWTTGLDSIPGSAGNSAPTQEYVLTFLIGANDLTAGGLDTSAYSTRLANFCDARRAAGWKVVLCTITARTDQPDGGAQFNLNRAAVNANIRTWVGVHCDAVADFAADPTMGTDTAPNNATYYNSQLHPTDAGHALLEPIIRAAVNSL